MAHMLHHGFTLAPVRRWNDVHRSDFTNAFWLTLLLGISVMALS